MLNWLFAFTAMLFVAGGAAAKPAENQYDLCARVESQDIDNPVLHQRLGSATALFWMWGMDSIDASAVTREWPAMQHAYFRENDTVLGDLFGLIRLQKAAALRPRLRKIDGSVSSWVLQGKP